MEQKTACLAGGPRRPGLCYLRHDEHRRYFADEALLDMFGRDVLAVPRPYPFVGPVNQLLRGLFVTDRFAWERSCDASFFIVVHDERNDALLAPEPPIPGYPAPTRGAMDQMLGLLAPGARPRSGAITTQALVRGYAEAAAGNVPAWLPELAERYGWDR